MVDHHCHRHHGSDDDTGVKLAWEEAVMMTVMVTMTKLMITDLHHHV